MAVIFLTDIRCRKCEHSIDTHMSGLCTRLGPAKIRCPKCSSIVRTGRTEWPDFTAGQKLWYVVLTILGACVIGYLGGVGVRGAVHFTQAGPWVMQFTLGGPGLYEGIAAWVVGVVALQWVRVLLSTRRSARADKKTRKPTRFVNITFDLQLKLLGVVWLPTIVAWIVSYLRAR